MSANEVNILYCVDGGARGRAWMEYSIDSLRKHLTEKVNIFVASDAPYSAPDVTWIDARRYIDKYGMRLITTIKKEGRTPSPMQIFRLAAPCLTELKHLDTILYIDIDTEIVARGLSKLFEKKFDADVLALVEHSRHGNESTRIMLATPELRKMMSIHTYTRLRNNGYFNSGVMVMNLKRIREKHPRWEASIPYFIKMAVKHHRCVVDQDITNVIMDALPLPPEFNVMPDTDVVIPQEAPILIHYASSSKYDSPSYPPANLREKVLK